MFKVKFTTCAFGQWIEHEKIVTARQLHELESCTLTAIEEIEVIEG